jgi:hypothetical protein
MVGNKMVGNKMVGIFVIIIVITMNFSFAINTNENNNTIINNSGTKELNNNNQINIGADIQNNIIRLKDGINNINSVGGENKEIHFIGGENTIIDLEGQTGFFLENGNYSFENIKFINGRSGIKMSNMTIGGAILSSNSNLTINNCVFQNCSADIGGAIAINTLSDENKVKISNTVIDNCSSYTGGAIYNVMSSFNPFNENQLLIEGCTIRKCLSNIGGGIYSQFELIGSHENNYMKYEDYRNRFMGDYKEIYEGQHVIINNSYFDENTAVQGGGAGVIVNEGTISHTNTSGNYAGYIGGFMKYSSGGDDGGVLVESDNFYFGDFDQGRSGQVVYVHDINDNNNDNQGVSYNGAMTSGQIGAIVSVCVGIALVIAVVASKFIPGNQEVNPSDAQPFILIDESVTGASASNGVTGTRALVGNFPINGYSLGDYSGGSEIFTVSVVSSKGRSMNQLLVNQIVTCMESREFVGVQNSISSSFNGCSFTLEEGPGVYMRIEVRNSNLLLFDKSNKCLIKSNSIRDFYAQTTKHFLSDTTTGKLMLKGFCNILASPSSYIANEVLSYTVRCSLDDIIGRYVISGSRIVFL